MSDRERWIVYPLLFLAIGMSMRNQALFDEDRDVRKHAESELIRCRGLEVVDASGKTRWIMGTTKSGEGLLELSGDEGKLAARLTSNPTGALLSLLDRTGELALDIGYQSQQILMIISHRLVPQYQVFRLPIIPPRDRDAATQKTDDEPATDGGGAPDTKADPSKESEPPSGEPAK
ncbi:MAG TPA: hypothetical protein VGI75_01105 [Pirellulales bacterium]